jgi:hypothetical protein
MVDSNTLIRCRARHRHDSDRIDALQASPGSVVSSTTFPWLSETMQKLAEVQEIVAPTRGADVLNERPRKTLG